MMPDNSARALEGLNPRLTEAMLAPVARLQAFAAGLSARLLSRPSAARGGVAQPGLPGGSFPGLGLPTPLVPQSRAGLLRMLPQLAGLPPPAPALPELFLPHSAPRPAPDASALEPLEALTLPRSLPPTVFAAAAPTPPILPIPPTLPIPPAHPFTLSPPHLFTPAIPPAVSERREQVAQLLDLLGRAIPFRPELFVGMLQSRGGARLAARLLAERSDRAPGLREGIRTAASQVLSSGGSERRAAARLGQVVGALGARSSRFLELLQAPETLAWRGGTALLAGLERAAARGPERARLLGEQLARVRPETAPLLARWLSSRGTEPTPLWGTAMAGLARSPRFALRFLAGLAGANPSQAQTLERVASAAPGRARALAFTLGQALASPEEPARPLAARVGSFIGARRELAGAVLAGATRELRRRGTEVPAGGLLWHLPVMPLARAAGQSPALREVLDAQLLKLARDPLLLERWVRRRPEALPRALERLPSLALPLVQSPEGRRALAAPRAEGVLARALPRVARSPLGRALAAPGNTRLQLLLARGAGALTDVAGGAVSGGILGLIRRPSLAQGLTREVGRGIRQATGRWPGPDAGAGKPPAAAPASGPRRQQTLLPPGVSGSRPGAAPPPPPVPVPLRAPHRPPMMPGRLLPLPRPGMPGGRLPATAAHLPGANGKGAPGTHQGLPGSGTKPAVHKQADVRAPHRPIPVRLPAAGASRRGTPAEHPGGQPAGPTQAARGSLMSPHAVFPRAAPRPAVPEGSPGAAALRQSLVGSDGAGQRIPPEHRPPLEQFFGRPMEDVRLHTGPTVAQTARSLRADAFTIGRDIFFGRGQLSPGTPAGQALLAHELTHVVQQTSLGQRLHGYGNAPQSLEEEARQVERVFRAWDVGAGDGGLRVGRYERTYVNMGQSPLTPDVEGRLERISLAALEVCERLLQPDIRSRADRRTLPRVEIDLDLDLARMSDAEAAEAWGWALARAVREKLEAAAPAPPRAVGLREEALRIQGDQVERRAEVKPADARKAERAASRRRLAGRDPNGPTISVPGPGGMWEFSTYRNFVHHQVWRITARAGRGGVMGVRMRVEQQLDYDTSKWKRYQAGHLRLSAPEAEKLKRDIEIETSVIRQLTEELRGLDEMAKELFPKFEGWAEQETINLLVMSQNEVEREARRYYGSDVTIGSIDEKSWMQPNEATSGMVSAARELAKLHRELAALKKEQEKHIVWLSPYTPTGRNLKEVPGQNKGSHESRYYFTDEAGYNAKEREIKEKQKEFDLKRFAYERKYPILANFTSRDDFNKLEEVGKGHLVAAALVGKAIAEKLKNIRLVWSKVISDEFDIWKFPVIVDLTIANHGLTEHHPETGLIRERREVRASRDRFTDIALSVLAIALAVIAAIPSGGSSVVALGGAAAGIGGATIGAMQAFKHLQEYELKKAASGTAFDKAKAISMEDPSFFWVALDFVTLGLDLAAAAKAFRIFLQVRQQAKLLGKFSSADREILEKLIKDLKLPPKDANRLLKSAEAAEKEAIPSLAGAEAAKRLLKNPADAAAREALEKFLKESVQNPERMWEFYRHLGWKQVQALKGKIPDELFNAIPWKLDEAAIKTLTAQFDAKNMGKLLGQFGVDDLQRLGTALARHPEPVRKQFLELLGQAQDRDAQIALMRLLDLNVRGGKFNNKVFAEIVQQVLAFQKRYPGKISGDFVNRFITLVTAPAREKISVAAELRFVEDLLEGRTVLGRQTRVHGIGPETPPGKPFSDVQGAKMPEMLATGGSGQRRLVEVKTMGEPGKPVSDRMIKQNLSAAITQIRENAVKLGTKEKGFVRLDSSHVKLVDTSIDDVERWANGTMVQDRVIKGSNPPRTYKGVEVVEHVEFLYKDGSKVHRVLFRSEGGRLVRVP
jgi:uncharacterized protein DUF4157